MAAGGSQEARPPQAGQGAGLFYFAEDVGPGLPLFTPKGEMLRYLMEAYVREVQTRYGYQHVWTGHLVKEDLYRRSGHYDNYEEVMFPPMVDENVTFRLKPMNCPCHMTLYKEMGLHSYRELPLRFAEFATLYRYEKTGELTGLTRVRALTQDDCHIFCTEDQIEQRVLAGPAADPGSAHSLSLHRLQGAALAARGGRQIRSG